jgi:hypothetical protein
VGGRGLWILSPSGATEPTPPRNLAHLRGWTSFAFQPTTHAVGYHLPVLRTLCPAFVRQIIYNFLTDAGQPVGKHSPMLREMNPCHVHPTRLLSCLTDRWMRSLWLLARGVLLGLQAGCTTKPPPPPTPLQKLQGTWSGSVLNDRSKAQYTLRIRGDSFHFHRDTNFWFGTTITVPAGTEPQQFFATIHTCAPGQENSLGKRVAAIFQVEEDNLIIVARGDGGDDVPTGFDVAGDEGLTRYELRRVELPR